MAKECRVFDPSALDYLDAVQRMASHLVDSTALTLDRLLITGHSLGAGLAVLAGRFLQMDRQYQSSRSLTVIAFSTPPTLDKIIRNDSMEDLTSIDKRLNSHTGGPHVTVKVNYIDKSRFAIVFNEYDPLQVIGSKLGPHGRKSVASCLFKPHFSSVLGSSLGQQFNNDKLLSLGLTSIPSEPLACVLCYWFGLPSDKVLRNATNLTEIYEIVRKTRTCQLCFIETHVFGLYLKSLLGEQVKPFCTVPGNNIDIIKFGVYDSESGVRLDLSYSAESDNDNNISAVTATENSEDSVKSAIDPLDTSDSQESQEMSESFVLRTVVSEKSSDSGKSIDEPLDRGGQVFV